MKTENDLRQLKGQINIPRNGTQFFKFWSLKVFILFFQEGLKTWIEDNPNEFENLTVPWTTIDNKGVPDWLKVITQIIAPKYFS